MSSKKIYLLSYKMFKPVTLKFSKAGILTALKNKLKIARIPATPTQYFSYVLFASLLLFITTFVLISLIGTIFFGASLLFIPIYFFFSLIVGMGTAIFIYFYPSFVVSKRKMKIDNTLAFATIYLSTISKSGFPPQKMFSLLSRFKDYGAVSQEAEKISSDVDGLGLDFPSALTRAISRSPSQNWAELLAGLRSTVMSGGELSKYLEEKAEGFVSEYKRKLKEFSRLLNLLMQMYITVVIVGTVFFVVISSLMATVGGLSVHLIKFTQYLIVFVGLPAITAIFILVIRSTSPWAD